MTDGPAVGVLYSCKGCGLKDREVRVRERFLEEDVVDWVDFCGVKVGRDHNQVSPNCASETCDLKIPLVDRGKQTRVGEAPRN